MSLSDIPDVHKVLINPTFGLSLTFTKYTTTNNEITLNDLTAGDYLIYASGQLASALTNPLVGNASFLLVIMGQPSTVLSTTDASNLDSGGLQLFTNSGILFWGPSANSGTLSFTISDGTTIINTFSTLIFWIAKIS
jgi:hypothetical protein